MVETGSSDKLMFTRQDLRNSTNFLEGDYNGINPRKFYRSLKRSLEEIQSNGNFKYNTKGEDDVDLKITKEGVGDKTGQVVGRILATSTPEPVGVINVQYRVNSPWIILAGSVLFIIGILLLELLFLFVSLIIIFYGYSKFSEMSTFQFPVQSLDNIRILMSGEVSERTVKQNDECITDIFANMSVIYSVNSVLTLPSDKIMTLSNHKADMVIKTLKQWYHENNGMDLDHNEGFIHDIMNAYSKPDPEYFRSLLNRIQYYVSSDIDLIIKYNEFLKSKIVDNTHLNRGNDALMSELRKLSENVDIFVKREGLNKV